MLKTYQMEDRLRAKLNERLMKLSDIGMPFGKYEGEILAAVPMSYLDNTISVMPKTWFVRRVIEFIDLAAEVHHEIYPNPQPYHSLDHVLAEIRKKLI